MRGKYHDVGLYSLEEREDARSLISGGKLCPFIFNFLVATCLSALISCGIVRTLLSQNLNSIQWISNFCGSSICIRVERKSGLLI